MSWWFQPLIGAALLLAGGSDQNASPSLYSNTNSFGSPTASIDGGGATGVLNLLDQGSSITNQTNITTASITITADHPVFVVLTGAGSTAGDGTFSYSLSGAGQSWTKIYESAVSGDDSAYTRFTIWTTDAASGGSGALTITTPEISSFAYAVVEFEPSSGATASLGTEVEATIAENTTTNSLSSLGSADYWVALAGASKASGYGSLSATPRSGWAECADVVALDSGWLAAVHVQLSPLDGDTDASVTWSQLVNIPFVAVPVTLTGGGGGGQSATLSLYSDPDTFGAPTATSAPLAVSPTAYSDGDTFGAPAATSAPLVGSPTTYSNPDAFGAPAATSAPLVATPTAYANPDAFGSPAATAAPLVGSPSAYNDGDAFGAPAATSAPLAVSPGIYSDPDAFGSPTASLDGSGDQNASPALYADGDAFGAPTATSAPLVASPTAYVNPDTFGAPAATSAPLAATPTAYVNPDAFGAPTATSAPLVASPTAYVNPDAFGTPTATSAPLVASPSAYSDGDAFGAPAATSVPLEAATTLYVDPDLFGAADVFADGGEARTEEPDSSRNGGIVMNWNGGELSQGRNSGRLGEANGGELAYSRNTGRVKEI